jgi:serine/threonine protein kinase
MGRAYYIMEHLQGKSLASVMNRAKGVSPEEILPLFRELLSALSVAHQKGVVHRDIKPANIFLLKEPQNGARVKLLDFGIAKLLTQTKGPVLSLPGVVLGTPAYMSPEQAMGKPVGVASDLYSVGVVLFEALTGDLPFGDGDDAVVMNAHVKQTYPKLSSRRPELAYLDSLLGQFLEKDLKKRFSSAADAISAILAAESPALPESDEGVTVRRAHIQEEPTLDLEKLASTNAPEEDDPDATHVARSSPKPKRLQENVEVSPSLLPSQGIQPVPSQAPFGATVKLRPLHLEPTPEPVRPPSRGQAPFLVLGVVGVLLLLGIIWFLTTGNG